MKISMNILVSRALASNMLVIITTNNNISCLSELNDHGCHLECLKRRVVVVKIKMFLFEF